MSDPTGGRRTDVSKRRGRGFYRLLRLVLILHDADKPDGYTLDDALIFKTCT